MNTAKSGVKMSKFLTSRMETSPYPPVSKILTFEVLKFIMKADCE